MSRPAVTSHPAAQIGSDIGPSQNTTNMGAGKSAAVITDPKVNGKLSSPQSVIDNVGHTKTKNGLVNHHNVLTNGVISPHIIRIERKMEPCQTVSMAKQTINGSANQKVPVMENGGKMAVQVPKESSVPSSVPLKQKERKERKDKEKKDKVHVAKPPHPDLKYLSEILTVPTVDLPQIDDQEWLFGCKDSEKKRPKLDSPNSESRNEVWSKAIHLESADVTALPYVIPY